MRFCSDERNRLCVLALFTLILSGNFCCYGFTGLNVDTLSAQLRFFGYEIASLFSPEYAAQDPVANKLRARLALPKRSFYYNGSAHPYRLHDYAREEEQEEQQMQRLNAEGRRWKHQSIHSSRTTKEAPMIEANNEVDSSVQQQKQSSAKYGPSPMPGFRDYFRRLNKQYSQV